MRHVGKPLGATFLGICKSFHSPNVLGVESVSMGTNPVLPAILILLLGFHRYFESQHFIIRGKFPASRGSIVLVSLVTFALIVASLVVVVAVAPTAFEKK
jgi:uncharacterized membrane protein YidH (DUF202 family)